eukprot:SAG31_NODE_788_length_12088_cov_3.916090_6_plen_208_part_00
MAPTAAMPVRNISKSQCANSTYPEPESKNRTTGFAAESLPRKSKTDSNAYACSATENADRLLVHTATEEVPPKKSHRPARRRSIASETPPDCEPQHLDLAVSGSEKQKKHIERGGSEVCNPMIVSGDSLFQRMMPRSPAKPESRTSAKESLVGRRRHIESISQITHTKAVPFRFSSTQRDAHQEAKLQEAFHQIIRSRRTLYGHATR